MGIRNVKNPVMGLLLVLSLIMAACGGTDSGDAADTEVAANDDADQAVATDGQSLSLTVGFGHAPGTITYATMMEDWFVPELERRVAEETPHELNVREAYAGSVAKHAEVLDATGNGLLDIGVVTYPFEPSSLFLHNMSFYVPFGAPDVETVLRAARSTFEANPELTEILEEEHNQKLLGLMAIDDYNLITTFPVEDLDDLQGQAIAAAGPNLPWLEPVGVVPVQGALTEAYTGLQTGVYEGWVLMAASTAGAKLYEVADYWTETNFGAALTGGVHINLDTFNGLPEDVQQIVVELGEEFEQRTPERVREDTEQAVQTMKDAGTNMSVFPRDQRVQWAEALPNIPNDRAQEANEQGLPGTKVMRDYLTFMEEEGYDAPRDWTID